VGDPFDGILRTATVMKADLIVMGAHHKQLLRDIFVGTVIERVMRTGSHSVLMVDNDVEQRYETVLAAVEMSEPSANAVRVAESTGLVRGTIVTFVHPFDWLAR
jgi:universal stress protein E